MLLFLPTDVASAGPPAYGVSALRPIHDIL
jgi:hypothetical protein